MKPLDPKLAVYFQIVYDLHTSPRLTEPERRAIKEMFDALALYLPAITGEVSKLKKTMQDMIRIIEKQSEERHYD
jgi:hypothetical protein